jgi:2-haloalkanoic acid dehalogenase type II
MVKAVLFDFWGTLVENGTTSPTREVLRIIRVRRPFREFIGPFEDTFFTQKWDSQEQGFRAVFDHFGARPHPIALEKCVGLWNKNKLLAKPYEDTEQVLSTLKKKGYKLALLSNTDNFSVDFVLDKYKLRDYFDAVLFSYDCGLLKSDPKMFEKVLDDLGVSADEAIMVGDSLETDVAGAKAAGVQAILIDHNGKRVFSPKVAQLHEILPIIEGGVAGVSDKGDDESVEPAGNDDIIEKDAAEDKADDTGDD